MKAWLMGIGIILSFLGRGQDVGLKLPALDSLQILSLDWYKTKSYSLTPVSGFNSAYSDLKTIFTSPYNYADDLGFFCKWELQADKKTKQPVRFRLGSYDYVNHLEGKEYLHLKN